MRSVSVSLGLQQADVERIQQDFFNSGDDVLSGDPDYVGDHGHGRSRRILGLAPAWAPTRSAQCNTFTVAVRTRSASGAAQSCVRGGQQGRGDGGDALTATGQTQPVGGGRRPG